MSAPDHAGTRMRLAIAALDYPIPVPLPEDAPDPRCTRVWAALEARREMRELEARWREVPLAYAPAPLADLDASARWAGRFGRRRP